MKTFPPMSIFLAMLGCFAVAHIYVFVRLWSLVPPSPWRWIILLTASLLTAAFFVGMAARDAEIPMWLTTVLYRIGTAWIFIFFYLFIAFVALDLLRLVRLVPSYVVLSNWLTFSILSASLTVVFTIGNLVYHNKKRNEITIVAPVERPLTIVAASDLHLGFGTGHGELSRWVDMINAERPDAVLFAGDIIDTSTKPLWQSDLASVFRRIDAPYGVFAVPGNHEYISGIDTSLRFMEHAGIRPLRDSTAIIAGGIAIVGRDDATNPNRQSINSLTSSLLPDVTTILLDHQPTSLQESADAGIELQISGHTHRGQVWPATWITDHIFPVSHGFGRVGETQVFVSQGLGIWGGKFRLGSRSEYLVIKIQPK